MRCLQIDLNHTKTSKLENNFFKEYLKDIFNKAGRSDLFNPVENYDRAFANAANSVFIKTPAMIDQGSKDDMMHDAFIKLVTPDLIKGYEDNRAPILPYLLQIFKKRVKNEFDKYMETHLHEVSNHPGDSDLTHDEMLDYKHNLTGPSNDPYHKPRYNELIAYIHQYLSKKPEAKYLLPILEYLPQGYQNNELAQMLHVSPKIITDNLAKFKHYLIQMGEENPEYSLLSEKMKELLHSRKHSEKADETDPLVTFFKDLKQKYSSEDEIRKPAGEVTTIKRTTMEDPFESDNVVKAILSDTITPTEFADEMNDFFAFLKGNQDILETDDGKIVGLRADETDVREIKDTPQLDPSINVSASLRQEFKGKEFTLHQAATLISNSYKMPVPASRVSNEISQMIKSSQLYKLPGGKFKFL